MSSLQLIEPDIGSREVDIIICCNEKLRIKINVEIVVIVVFCNPLLYNQFWQCRENEQVKCASQQLKWIREEQLEQPFIHILIFAT